MTFDAAALRGDLFHLLGPKIEPGGVVLPGNFGRVLRAWGPLHKSQAREQALEEARLRIAPDLPSRLECIFVFVTLDEARAFQGVITPLMRVSRGFEAHLLYRVRLLEPEAPHYLADYTLVTPVDAPDFRASAYWEPRQGPEEGIPRQQAVNVRSGLRPGTRELLTLSRVRIEECLDDA